MKEVRVYQDDSCHWYVIPASEALNFLGDLENEDLIDSGEFSEKWGQYMTGGDINNIRLFADL